MSQDNQERIWEFLCAHADEHGYAPSIREIGVAIGAASVSTVVHHLDALQRAGRLHRSPRSPRSIELCRPPKVASVEVLQRFLRDGRNYAWEAMSDRDWRGLAVALDGVITQALDNETGWTVNQ